MSGVLGFRRAAVLGLGRSGASAARLLAAEGVEVRASERDDTPALQALARELAGLGVSVQLGGDHPELAAWAEVLVVSPGVPPGNPVIAAALQRGLPVWSEVELAWRFATVPVLAVTGTNGKTTTTSLLAEILGAAGHRAVAAGNIGFPLVDAVRETRSAPGGAVIVCEVSSFQLAFTETFRPAIGVVLNVADDHYDWHQGYADYRAAKARIAASQTVDDLLVANTGDAGAWSIAQEARSRPAGFGLGTLESVLAAADGLTRPLAGAAGIEGGWVTVQGQGGPVEVAEIAKIRLTGPHNLENVLAASLAARAWGVDAEVIGRAVAGFEPLAHRTTCIAEINGVRYVDDSKATNPHATLRALQGMQRVVLIAGGRAKGLDLSPLAGESARLLGVIAMGEAIGELEAQFSGLLPFSTAGSVEEAVSVAAGWANPGDVVLLSPACSSLDQYSSYAERGDRFAAAVRALEPR